MKKKETPKVGSMQNIFYSTVPMMILDLLIYEDYGKKRNKNYFTLEMLPILSMYSEADMNKIRNNKQFLIEVFIERE